MNGEAHVHIQPAYRGLLQGAGLADFDALFAAGEQEYVDGHLSRSVSRLRLTDAAGKPVVLYLKRRWGRAAGRSWADLLGGRWPTPPMDREWHNTQRLIEAGIPMAEPVAYGCRAGPHADRGLLVFREAAGPSLAAWVHALAAGPDSLAAGRRRKHVAIAVGRAVRRLHRAGFAFHDLYAKHVFLEHPDGPSPRVVFIDAQRLRRANPWTRLRDLAALHATTLLAGVRRTDRLRFLRAYLGRARLGARGRALVRCVNGLGRWMAGRGQDPNLVPGPAAAPPGGTASVEDQFVLLDHGRLRVNRAFLPALEAAGLTTLAAIMAFRGGRPYRLAPGRRTVRTELASPAGPAGSRSAAAPSPRSAGRAAVYIKRHTRVPLRTALRRAISLAEPASLAWQEARAVARVAALGIPAMRLVAVGEEITRLGMREQSCLITEEVPDAVQADDYCEAHFARDSSPQARRRKRRLIRAMADLARRFHGAGLVHRDFYLCHILVRPMEGGDPALHLIDLQRVGRRAASAPRRWIVKDLAALLFSSWPSPATGIRSAVFTQTDRMRFAREYFGVRHLGLRQKRLARSILRKARGIESRRRRRARS